MSDSTTNLHFHGLSIPPKCHQDEVIHTAIAAGTSFDYRIRIPLDEPSGLYWYHPHFHGVTQKQLPGRRFPLHWLWRESKKALRWPDCRSVS